MYKDNVIILLFLEYLNMVFVSNMRMIYLLYCIISMFQVWTETFESFTNNCQLYQLWIINNPLLSGICVFVGWETKVYLLSRIEKKYNLLRSWGVYSCLLSRIDSNLCKISTFKHSEFYEMYRHMTSVIGCKYQIILFLNKGKFGYDFN